MENCERALNSIRDNFKIPLNSPGLALKSMQESNIPWNESLLVVRESHLKIVFHRINFGCLFCVH